MNKKVAMASVSAVAFLALAFAPVAAADSNSRTFVGVIPSVEVTFVDGIGLFSPGDPDNTCIALLGIRTPGLDVFYYETLRIFIQLVALSVPIPAVNTETLLPPGINNDCLGLTTPTNELGWSAGQVRVGLEVPMDTITGANQVAVVSSIVWTLRSCPFATSAGVTSTPNPIFPLATGGALVCGAGASVPVDFSSLVTFTALGDYSTEFDEPFVNQVIAVGSEGALRSSTCADLLDVLTGLITNECSHDWSTVTGVPAILSLAALTWGTNSNNIYNLEGDNGA